MMLLPLRPAAVTLAASLLSLTIVPALSAPVETPEAFVRRVYAHYRTSADPGVPTSRPGGAAFYTAALLDAFAKDEAMAHGEVGAIDGDPICNCQDYGKLRVKAVAVEEGAAGTLKAQVDFVNLGSRQTITLTLSRTPAGWRIADIADKDMKSVMAALQDAIAHPVQPASDGAAEPVKPKP